MHLTRPVSSAAVLQVAKLRVLQTSDIHGHVLAFDYNNNEAFKHRGLSRTAVSIKKARAEAPLNLLLDVGDFLQGSPLADTHAGTAPSEPHPVITAMNTLAYDAVTLGNHDLDFGLEHLSDALSTANFPIVSANLQLPGGHRLSSRIKRFTILERQTTDPHNPLRIGVTGFLPDDTLDSSTAQNSPVKCAPVGPALALALSEMEQAGVDIIIVLAHSALDAEAGPETREALIDVLAKNEKVSLILGGHTHEVSTALGAETKIAALSGHPTLIAGAWGEHMGQADLTLTAHAAGWKVSGTRLQTYRNPADARECQMIVDALEGHHSKTLSEVSRPLGKTTRQIDSFFALAQDNAGLQLLAESFEQHIRTALVNTVHKNMPVLSVVAPFRSGGRAGATHYCHIPKGTVAHRDIDKLYSFHDTLCALQITGKALRVWLEMSASVFARLPEGAQDAPLLDPAFPGYLFDVIPQLDYEIDISRPALFDVQRRYIGTEGSDGRISALTYRGKPVGDNDRFILASSSYRAKTKWPEPSCPQAPALVLDTQETCRSVLSAHISNQGTISPIAHPSWRFKPMPQTTACFLTSPKAESCPSQGIEFVRTTAGGFSEMRLSLSQPGHAQPLANPNGAAYIVR